MPDRPIPFRRAKDALAHALLDPSGYSEPAGELVVRDASRQLVADLLLLLDPATVGTDEWTGSSGVPHRDYYGLLPCGLVLKIGTDAEHVPPMPLPEGGGSR